MTLDDRIATARTDLHHEISTAPFGDGGAITRRLAGRRRRRLVSGSVAVAALLAFAGWFAGNVDDSGAGPHDGSPGPEPAAITVEHDGLRGVVPEGWTVETDGCAGTPRTVFIGASDSAEPTFDAAWIWLRPVAELEEYVRACSPGYFGSSVAEQRAGATNRIAFCQVNGQRAPGEPDEIRFIDGLDLAIVINFGESADDSRRLNAVKESWTYDRQFELEQSSPAVIAYVNAWLAADCETMRRFADRAGAELCPQDRTDATISGTTITGRSGSVPRTSFRVTLSSGAVYDVDVQYVFSTTTFRGRWLVAAFRVGN